MRDYKTLSIEHAFERLEGAPGKAEEDDLAFDTEPIPRSIAARLGGSQEKMAHTQYLIVQGAQAMDEEHKSLLNVIQWALFSSDLSQLGRDLKELYWQAWEMITTSVEARGIDPRMFTLIASNALAVLGSAAAERSE